MCGILAYYSNNSQQTLLEFKNDLIKLQHRGQDSCGISFIKNHIHHIVNEPTFKELENKINNKESTNIIGHVRYTTSGSKSEPIYQPYYSENKYGKYTLIFNGNIPIYNDTHTSDTLMIIYYLNETSEDININTWLDLLKKFIENFDKSYSLIIQTATDLFIMRDSYGVRPLYYTENVDTNTYKFSSESYVFKESDNPIEIKAGTIFSLNTSGFKNIYDYSRYYQSHCLFEYIYFLNKKSHFENTKVSEYRIKVGEIMAKEDVDMLWESEEYIVVGIPNTGNDYAISYANTIGIKYKNYITKNNDVNRTFILKTDIERHKYANIKYIFNENIKNKNIIIIDDSLVRGITLINLIRNLREFGVNEIHVRIASPPINDTCIYGIDIPTKKELIFNSYDNISQLTAALKCDSIKYLNISKLKEALADFNNKCTMCLNTDTNLEW
jgi:amidophosphoribosyltransferase